jgi:dihydropteroate synthase
MTKIDLPTVMGIINLNDDSFFKESRFRQVSDAMKKIEEMLEQGAGIIDIGACSTRPGSLPVNEEVEWQRLEPLLLTLKNNLPHIKLSIDTFRSSIVIKSSETFGEFIINDISAGEDDSYMLKTAGSLGFTYIAMHKRGTPLDMQTKCNYNDVVEDIHDYFVNFLAKADDAGIRNLIIDPGFGFSKTLDQNYQLLKGLKRLELYRDFKKIPILAGLSRKSMIYKLFESTPQEALAATSAINLFALMNGADILRVHDVKEGVECVKLFLKLIPKFVP